MKFHQNCGKNVKLSQGNIRAERIGDSYDNGIVYSARPLAHDEIFQLKIMTTELKWAGSLRIGVTTLNPNEPEKCVFRAATELLAPQKFNNSYWLWSSNTLFETKNEHKLTLNYYRLNYF